MARFIDLHCDTITASFEKNEELYQNNLHIDIKKLKKHKSSIQIFAIWLKKEYYSIAYDKTKVYIDFFKEEMGKNAKYIAQAKSFKDILKNQNENKHSAILAIEGGESLQGDLINLEKLYINGVRILTLCWNFENEIGYGASTKIYKGLKKFGKELIQKMNELGIIIDVSHLNEAGFWDVYNLSSKPFIASHSNAFGVCKHLRNLKDDQIKAIKERNGLIGINFYPPFLTNEKEADLHNIFEHIDYISNLIGFENIALGGDLDGIDSMPKYMKDISSYEYLFQKMVLRYGLEISEKIFFNNAYNFLEKNL